jgi:hypothetical protein
MAASIAAVAPADGRSRRGRLLLAGGARTTIHVACHDADRTEIGVAVLGQERLEPIRARRSDSPREGSSPSRATGARGTTPGSRWPSSLA